MPLNFVLPEPRCKRAIASVRSVAHTASLGEHGSYSSGTCSLRTLRCRAGCPVLPDLQPRDNRRGEEIIGGIFSVNAASIANPRICTSSCRRARS